MIGRATALAFPAARAAVVIGDVDPRVEGTARDTAAVGGKAVFQKTDVSDSGQFDPLLPISIRLDQARVDCEPTPRTAALSGPLPSPRLCTVCFVVIPRFRKLSGCDEAIIAAPNTRSGRTR